MCVLWFILRLWWSFSGFPGDDSVEKGLAVNLDAFMGLEGIPNSTDAEKD